MIVLCALVLAAVTPTMPPAAFPDRAARLETRIADDQSRKRLAPGQDALLRVELDATRRAYAAHDPAADYMLDVIDRQLAEVDHTLSRSEDGRGITVHVGDTVTVALYDRYTWNVSNSDPTVLSMKTGVMWARRPRRFLCEAAGNRDIESYAARSCYLKRQTAGRVYDYRASALTQRYTNGSAGGATGVSLFAPRRRSLPRTTSVPRACIQPRTFAGGAFSKRITIGAASARQHVIA